MLVPFWNSRPKTLENPLLVSTPVQPVIVSTTP
jgi:OPA family sugar phosphate sensor protein UhpC-like MFS transporter